MPRKKEEALRLVLYTRPGCHLCDEMKAEIARARLGGACEVAEVDVDSDPVLAGRYGLSIPVLELDGRPLFKGRCTAEDLRRKLERARLERGTA
jgi:thioredoxin-like negative regulator of GroEL